MEGQNQNTKSSTNQPNKSPNISIRSPESQQSQNQSESPGSVNTTQNTVVDVSQSMQERGGLFSPVVCTPGLEYLINVDQLLIKERVKLFEVFFGCEMKNEYSIQNNLGQQKYEAKEVSGFCERLCCDRIRPLDMIIKDYYGREVIYFERPLRCDCCICFCCLQKIRVESPRGNVIGYVIQDWSILFPRFHIENSLRQTVLEIKGPLITCSCCCGDVHFDISTVEDPAPIGRISKLWSGCIRETLTDTDFFRVAFPLDLEVNMKAVLISAAFLIDYIYFNDGK